MNKTLLTLSAAALLLAAGTASAQTNANFTGIRAEAQAVSRDVSNTRNINDLTYAGTLGVDAPLGDRFTIGAETNVTNLFDDNGREFGVGARLGYAVNEDLLVFARAGYARLDDARSRTLEGLAVGAGAEWSLSEHSFISAQYRYTDFEQGVGSHGALIGIGLRF